MSRLPDRLRTVHLDVRRTVVSPRLGGGTRVILAHPPAGVPCTFGTGLEHPFGEADDDEHDARDEDSAGGSGRTSRIESDQVERQADLIMCSAELLERCEGQVMLLAPLVCGVPQRLEQFDACRRIVSHPSSTGSSVRGGINSVSATQIGSFSLAFQVRTTRREQSCVGCRRRRGSSRGARRAFRVPLVRVRLPPGGWVRKSEPTFDVLWVSNL